MLHYTEGKSRYLLDDPRIFNLKADNLKISQIQTLLVVSNDVAIFRCFSRSTYNDL